MKGQGARARLVVIDASRRNPYERRFRTFSRGLAPINAPGNALVLTSASPGKVADDSKGQHSVLMAELLNNLNTQATSAQTVFNKTRVAIALSSDGEQVPSVSSALSADVQLVMDADRPAEPAGNQTHSFRSLAASLANPRCRATRTAPSLIASFAAVSLIELLSTVIDCSTSR